MILSKKLYIRDSIFKRIWIKRQIKKINKSTKFFTLGSWKSYLHPVRSGSIPKFVGSKKDLQEFKEAKNLESLCPTNALKVTSETIQIDPKNCIRCQECVKASPDDFFDTNQEKFPNDP
ncbi:MAG TPA: hypothetical protein VKZ84_06765 [Bacteriovoracaceae bacterium]|nr:hypothetical protein [Bacteriovoracaceae bacterium]